MDQSQRYEHVKVAPLVNDTHFQCSKHKCGSLCMQLILFSFKKGISKEQIMLKQIVDFSVNIGYIHGISYFGFHHHLCLSLYRKNINKIKNLSLGSFRILVHLTRNDPVPKGWH